MLCGDLVVIKSGGGRGLPSFHGGAPFIENQEPNVFATYCKKILFTSFWFDIIKPYTYGFNDINISDNMYK
jgi:hypothetical protein